MGDGGTVAPSKSAGTIGSLQFFPVGPHERNQSEATIARIWRGCTTRAKADEYAAYLYEDPSRIHHPRRDPEFLIQLPESVQAPDFTASKSLF